MIDAHSLPVYLASRSPRRRELLMQIGVRFMLIDDLLGTAPDVDEIVHPDEPAEDYVHRVTRDKADAGWQRVAGRDPAAPVLAADTTVVLGDRILGKPADRGEAAGMLATLSGQVHEVLTAVGLRLGERYVSALSRSRVTFRRLAPEEIRAYVDSGEADDKAGAYGIQGRAAQFVSELQGSYSAVVGLPLYETAQLIEALGRERAA